MEEGLVRQERQDLANYEPIELSVEEIVNKVAKVREVAAKVMKEGIHFGTIPGTPKPTLYKAGGEILALTFRLAPKYENKRIDLPKGHVEYQVNCFLYHIHNGEFYGSGVGSCSTMEGKYRYRWENTGRPVPQEYWDTRDSSILGGPTYVARKAQKGTSKVWMIFQRVEHDNPADYANTALKMAAKRAYVDAILKATAASEVYTQDLEDLPNGSVGEEHGGATSPPPQEAPPPTGESEPPAQSDSGADSRLISDKQRKRLYAIAKGSGCSDDMFKDELLRMGVESSKDITRDQYDDIVSHFESLKQAD